MHKIEIMAPLPPAGGDNGAPGRPGVGLPAAAGAHRVVAVALSAPQKAFEFEPKGVATSRSEEETVSNSGTAAAQGHVRRRSQSRELRRFKKFEIQTLFSMTPAK